MIKDGVNNSLVFFFNHFATSGGYNCKIKSKSCKQSKHLDMKSHIYFTVAEKSTFL